MHKQIKLIAARELPRTRDGDDFRFNFSVVDVAKIGKPDERSSTTLHTVNVFISGRIQAAWLHFDEEIDLFKVTFWYAKEKIAADIKNLQEIYTINIVSGSFPGACPYDSSRINLQTGNIYIVEIDDTLSSSDSPIVLVQEIVSLRQAVNNQAKNKFSAPLLLAANEQDAVQLSKPVITREEFVMGVCALRNIIVQNNAEFLQRALGPLADKSDKSISLLEKFLKLQSNYDSRIIGTIRHINRLRMQAPVHGDNVTGVKEAHDFFQLEYPLKDYVTAWVKVLTGYRDSLKNLLTVIS